jgi:hypothetical protein
MGMVEKDQTDYSIETENRVPWEGSVLQKHIIRPNTRVLYLIGTVLRPFDTSYFDVSVI